MLCNCTVCGSIERNMLQYCTWIIKRNMSLFQHCAGDYKTEYVSVVAALYVDHKTKYVFVAALYMDHKTEYVLLQSCTGDF